MFVQYIYNACGTEFEQTYQDPKQFVPRPTCQASVFLVKVATWSQHATPNPKCGKAGSTRVKH